MFGWFRKRQKATGNTDRHLRAVVGAGVYRRTDGQVIYNMLDPMMQQFLARCVGAIKKSGLRAKGTGQFSILLGDSQRHELRLDEFWARYAVGQDQEVFEDVVQVARKTLGT